MSATQWRAGEEYLPPPSLAWLIPWCQRHIPYCKQAVRSLGNREHQEQRNPCYVPRFLCLEGPLAAGGGGGYRGAEAANSLPRRGGQQGQEATLSCSTSSDLILGIRRSAPGLSSERTGQPSARQSFLIAVVSLQKKCTNAHAHSSLRGIT